METKPSHTAPELVFAPQVPFAWTLRGARAARLRAESAAKKHRPLRMSIRFRNVEHSSSKPEGEVLMKRFRGGKRRIATSVVALVALSIGVSVALAKSGPTQIQSKLYLRNNPVSSELCPQPGDKLKKAGGKVTITSEKGEWTIAVHLRGAEPGLYHIDLRDPNCDQFGTAVGGYFKVGSDGSGDKTVSYSASGFQSFYLRAHGPSSYFTPLLKIGG